MSETGGMCGRCGGTAAWTDISGMRRCLACDPPRPPMAVATKKANRMWIWGSVAGALILVVVVGGMFVRTARRSDPEMRRRTQIRVHRVASDSFARWSLKSPNKPCPASLFEMISIDDSQARPDELNDEWGQPLKFLCGDSLPAGAKGIAVWSVGEDGLDDTGYGDDIKSW